jgi:hypothetical protein
MSMFNAWANFYLLTAAAAATLAGMLFVSLTFSVGLIPGETDEALRIWAEPSLSDFIQVIAISACLEMPAPPPGLLGTLLLVYTFVRYGRLWRLIRHFRGIKAPTEFGYEIGFVDWRDLVILPALIYSLALVCGVGLCSGWVWVPACLAVYTLAVLFQGIHNTWEQLVWIAVAKNKRVKKR